MSLFPGLFTRNWQLKLSALAMAVLLWTVPRFENQAREVLEDVPVRVQVNDPEWALLGEPLPGRVRVTVSGPARALFALAGDRPSILVPVDQVVASDTTVLLRPTWLRLPNLDGVEVETIEPISVRLTFELVEVAEVPLAPRFVGTLPDSLSPVGPPILSAASARVVGATSRVRGLDSLPLLPLDLTEVTGPGPYTVRVDTARLGGMPVSPEEVSLRIRVEETLERTFPDVPLNPPELGEGPRLQVRPETVTVTLVGARSLVEAVEPGVLRAVVSLPEAFPPGAEEWVPVSVAGVPPLVEARAEPERVLLRRPAGL